MPQWGLFGKLTVHGGPGILDTMTIKPFLAATIAPFLLLAAPAWAQKEAKPAPSPSPEAALVAVARHLSDAYALYLYESLTAQV